MYSNFNVSIYKLIKFPIYSKVSTIRKEIKMYEDMH